jgi:hypothetical protein
MGLRGNSIFLGRIYALGLVLATSITTQALKPEQAAAFSPTCVRLFEDTGPKLRFELPGFRKDPTAAKFKRLKIGHYSLNTFNYFPAQKSRPVFRNKNAVIRAILFHKPDIVTLTEVMNHETLQALSRKLLNLYEPIMIDGNGKTSVAVLIRKTLPLHVEVESHRALQHNYLGNSVPLFSRDLLLVHLTLPGATRPLLTLGTSHFKAHKMKRSTFASDPYFKIKRSEQEKFAVEIIEAAGSLRASRARIFIGDMNSDVRRSDEMPHLRAAGYRESLEVLDVPMERRTSHSYFPMEGEPSFWQTDAAYVSPEIYSRNALVGGYIAADRSLAGNVLGKPRNFEELATRGSDHRMIMIEIDITRLH